MTMIQNIGFFGFNLLIGWANDFWSERCRTRRDTIGMWIFSVLGFLGVLFDSSCMNRETGPHGHGLETITTKSAAG